MTTTKINSIKKVRLLISSEDNINKLISYYNVVEKLMYHYKRVLNKAKEMEATRLLLKIRMVIIERMMLEKNTEALTLKSL
jgi:hypothetical protein